MSILTFGPVLLFGLFGVIISLSKIRQTILLLFIIMSFAFAYSFFMTQVRYRIPIEPFLIIFAGYGIEYALKKVNVIFKKN